MVAYTKEELLQRKNTIRTNEILKILDRNSKPTAQPLVIMHPRWNNKSFSCQMGKHDYFTDVLMGVPFLTCRKCGATTLKSGVEHNETQREVKRKIPNPINQYTANLADLFKPRGEKR